MLENREKGQLAEFASTIREIFERVKADSEDVGYEGTIRVYSSHGMKVIDNRYDRQGYNDPYIGLCDPDRPQSSDPFVLLKTRGEVYDITYGRVRDFTNKPDPEIVPKIQKMARTLGISYPF